MIRVVIPFHLRTLAQVEGEVKLNVPAPVTQRITVVFLCGQRPRRRVNPI